MTEEVKTAADYEVEIEIIDVELESLRRVIEKLNAKRSDLVTRRKHVDIVAALESIEETGVTIDDVLDLINKELTRRRFVASEAPY